MPHKVGWQFIGHMVRTVFAADSLKDGSRVQAGIVPRARSIDGT
jgi:hypothetical protein